MDAVDPATGAAAKSKSGFGLVSAAILCVSALVSSLATVYMITPASAAGTESACAAESASVVPLVKEGQVYVELDEIIITIGSAPADRYLKLNLSVMTGKGNSKTVEEAMPVLKDAFMTYLRSVELKDFEDPDFYGHMREQLGRRADLVLGSSVSQGILITEFLLR